MDTSREVTSSHSKGVSTPSPSIPDRLQLANTKHGKKKRAPHKSDRKYRQSSRPAVVFISSDGVVLARSGSSEEGPIVRRVRMEGGSILEVPGSPREEERELCRIQAVHTLRQISHRLETARETQPQVRELPVYPCNPYNQSNTAASANTNIASTKFTRPSETDPGSIGGNTKERKGQDSDGSYSDLPSLQRIKAPSVTHLLQATIRQNSQNAEASSISRPSHTSKASQPSKASMTAQSSKATQPSQSSNTSQHSQLSKTYQPTKPTQPGQESKASSQPFQQSKSSHPTQQAKSSKSSHSSKSEDTNLALMTVLSNSCTTFTGQVDVNSVVLPDRASPKLRKISHDLPYQACSEDEARIYFSKK